MAAPASPPSSGPSGPATPSAPPASGPTGAADELPIDVEMIKVLASDSRRDILRLLGERRKTLTELSEALGLKKATVLEHLKKLQDANLIKRLDEDERLWIYYELSPRGKRLVHPERTRFYLIMAGSVLALVTIAAIVVAATMLGAPGISSPSADDDAAKDAAGAPAVASGIDATVPDVLWRGFDADVPIELETTPEGSQLLIGDASAPAASIPAEDGRVVLSAQTIDALPPGRHALALRTTEGLLGLPLQLDVRDPPIAVVPAVLLEGEQTRLDVSVGDPSLRQPDVGVVRIDGVELWSSGDDTFLTPQLAAGAAQVEVGRLAEVPIAVLPRVPLEWALDDANLSIATVPAAEVLLDGSLQGVADESGKLTIPWPATGEHVLRVVAPDGRAQDRPVVVSAERIAPLAPRLTLNAFHGGGPQVLSAHVDVRNAGPANETVTLVARKAGHVVASTAVTLPPGESTTASLRAEIRTDQTIDIEAFAARDGLSTLSGRAATSNASAGSTAPARTTPAATAPVAASQAPPPSGPVPVAPAAPAASEDSASSMLVVFGRQPDARASLPPLVPTTPATDGGVVFGGQEEAPAVPGPSAALLLAAVALAAIALRRRGARRP